MLIKRDSFAVFNTTESEGRDICIKDDVGRYMLIYETDLSDLIDTLLQVEVVDGKSYSVFASFDFGDD